jgi:predicted outer membrane repeat protein
MKKNFFLMLCIGLLFSPVVFGSTTYYVQLGTTGAAAWDASFSNTGTIVDLSTINGGAAASFNAWFADKSQATPTFAGTKFASGDQVWIAKGTYYLTGTVTLYIGVSIYGGFAGTVGETIITRAYNSSAKWDFKNPSIFDGSVNGSKTYIGFTGGSTSSTIVDGITIQNCTNSTSGSSGGGAKINGTGTTMQNCIITACTASGSVGTGASAGITLTSGAKLKDSYIHHNTSTSTGNGGGGIGVYGNDCAVTGCKIENNTATSAGGLYLYSSTSGVSIADCNFSNNSATSNGGAISSYITATNVNPINISNCTFNNNSATGSGGALNLSSTVTTNKFNVENCTFTSNSSSASNSTSSGGGAVMLSTATFNIDKCIFSNNSTSLSYGGALMIPSVASCIISNSKFFGNTCGTTTATGGAAIYSKTNYTANNCLFANNTGPTVVHFYSAALASAFNNCTFVKNLSSTGASANISLLALTPAYSFTNCLFNKIGTFTAQTPTFTNCGFETTIPAGGVNCITDIVDASFANYDAGDFSLNAYSPAIDTGKDLSLETGSNKITTDILGCTRPVGGGFDIGCYEFGGVLPNALIIPKQNIIGFLVSKNYIIPKYTGAVQLFSITGELVMQKQVTEGEQISVKQGLYIVKLSTQAGVIAQKINISSL